jgi:hypothetical protein
MRTIMILLTVSLYLKLAVKSIDEFNENDKIILRYTTLYYAMEYFEFIVS